jgi:hypothetical protein
VNVSRTGKSLCASFALFVISGLHAQAHDFETAMDYAEPPRNVQGFHAVQRLGITLGGNVISKFARPDGTFREISAGGLYQIGLGALYRARDIPFSAALILNYQYDSDYNNNDNASFRRVPLESLLYWNCLDNFRIGGGMRYIYAARANSNINGISERFTFENTRGSIVEIGYQVRPYGWVNLRYVKEIYRVATYSTTGTATGLSGTSPYNGSHVGLFVGYEY